MARLPVPGPRELLRLTTGSYQAVEQAIALVPRVSSLIDQVERVVQRADTLVAEVERTRQRTDQVVEQAGMLVQRSTGLVDATDRLLPLLDRLAATTSPAEVDAIVLLVDTMPELVDRLRKEILPILASMTNVAPDVRELLDTTKEFTAILGSLPGLGRIKKRIEEHEEEHDRERAEIEATVERP